MAVTRSTPVAIAAFGVLSLAVATLGGLIQVMIQESTPGEFRGRVMSLYMLTWSTASPLAGIVAAAAADVVGLPAVMAASAILALATESAVLALAGGGIQRVVAACAGEYDAALEA
jgi:dipeptide/tripeptide permease